MKILHKILISIGIILLIVIVIIADIADRDIYYSIHIPKEEFQTFHFKPTDEKLESYKNNFGNPKWKFPREITENVILYKNKPLISRITSKKLKKTEIKRLIEILNNPDNFNWNETTWMLREAEYILRFYNSENKKIGEIWICLDDCGMTKSIPFSPNMKFGGLNKNGKEKIIKLLEEIQQK